MVRYGHSLYPDFILGNSCDGPICFILSVCYASILVLNLSRVFCFRLNAWITIDTIDLVLGGLVAILIFANGARVLHGLCQPPRLIH